MCIRYYQGERLYLRPVELADEPLLRRWVNDPANWKTLGRFLPVSEQREREFIEGLYKSAEDLVLGIVARQEDRLIGVGGLSRIHAANRSATFGILIGDPGSQSRGFGTEATRLMLRYGFGELNLNRIALTVFADHQRAIRAYRRAGFVEEGRLRQACYRNGRYHDELCFAILRSEWERQEVTEDEQEQDEDVDHDGLPAVQLAAMTMWDTRVPT
ncbi:MAG TPA: GNAT family protein [Phycisphaerae bacterium]|nr:GNAT family protein [Phycisphaerae bacterium]